jgi:hypothetical protein
MIISAIDTAETGGNFANLLFSMSLIFCGYAWKTRRVLRNRSCLLSFWG